MATNFTKTSNNGQTTLNSPISSLVSTTIAIDPAHTSRFPSSGNFYIEVSRLSDSTIFETMLVTGVSVNNFTVIRAYDGTTAKTFSVGDIVRLKVRSEHLSELQNAVNTAENDIDSIESNYSNAEMLRQSIINGNFNVWQRSTSVNVVGGPIYSAADRWRYFADGGSGGTQPTVTMSRQVLSPGDITNSFYYHRTAYSGAGSSIGADMTNSISQRIEHGTRFLCGVNKKVTVSFWAKSSIVNKRIGVLLTQNYGTSGGPSSTEDITGTFWTLTSSWVKYTYTFTTNTLVGKTFGSDNNDYLQISFILSYGASRAALVGDSSASLYAAGNVDIAQIQICSGDIAVPFSPRSLTDELARCQRYYEKSFDINTSPADAASSNGALGIISQSSNNYISLPAYFRVAKRIPPTISLYNPSVSSSDKIRNATTATNLPGATSFIGENGFLINVNNVSVAATNTLLVHWTADAEL